MVSGDHRLSGGPSDPSILAVAVGRRRLDNYLDDRVPIELPNKKLLRLCDYPPPDAARDRLMAESIQVMLDVHAPEILAFYREIWLIAPQKRLLLTSSISIPGVFCSIVDMQADAGVIPYIPERPAQAPLFEPRGRLAG